MNVRIKEVKRVGRYNIETDEQPEIILEFSGRMCVYGDGNLDEFYKKFQTLIEEYAI